ncbi:MAG: hypothetical protein ABIC95_03495 [archaeon]
MRKETSGGKRKWMWAAIALLLIVVLMVPFVAGQRRTTPKPNPNALLDELEGLKDTPEQPGANQLAVEGWKTDAIDVTKEPFKKDFTVLGSKGIKSGDIKVDKEGSDQNLLNKASFSFKGNVNEIKTMTVSIGKDETTAGELFGFILTAEGKTQSPVYTINLKGPDDAKSPEQTGDLALDKALPNPIIIDKTGGTTKHETTIQGSMDVKEEAFEPIINVPAAMRDRVTIEITGKEDRFKTIKINIKNPDELDLGQQLTYGSFSIQQGQRMSPTYTIQFKMADEVPEEQKTKQEEDGGGIWSFLFSWKGLIALVAMFALMAGLNRVRKIKKMPKMSDPASEGEKSIRGEAEATISRMLTGRNRISNPGIMDLITLKTAFLGHVQSLVERILHLLTEGVTGGGRTSRELGQAVIALAQGPEDGVESGVNQLLQGVNFQGNDERIARNLLLIGVEYIREQSRPAPEHIESHLQEGLLNHIVKEDIVLVHVDEDGAEEPARYSFRQLTTRLEELIKEAMDSGGRMGWRGGQHFRNAGNDRIEVPPPELDEHTTNWEEEVQKDTFGEEQDDGADDGRVPPVYHRA